MSSSTDPTTRQLEARIAELERRLATTPSTPPPRARRGLVTRLAAVGLALALVIPAGGALASHQFSDVPTSHQFHNAIDAIADAGITTGCGGGRYCPNGLVTRGQMAAFLSRLGALQPGSAPKVNADRLDGYHANELVRVAHFDEHPPGTAIPTTATQYGDSVTIIAPTAGFVIVQVNVTFQNSGCTTGCTATLEVDHVEGGGFPYQSLTSVPGLWASASVGGVGIVDAGPNHFNVMVSRGAGNATIEALRGGGTVMFVPFGINGGTVTADS